MRSGGKKKKKKNLALSFSLLSSLSSLQCFLIQGACSSFFAFCCFPLHADTKKVKKENTERGVLVQKDYAF